MWLSFSFLMFVCLSGLLKSKIITPEGLFAHKDDINFRAYTPLFQYYNREKKMHYYRNEFQPEHAEDFVNVVGTIFSPYIFHKVIAPPEFFTENYPRNIAFRNSRDENGLEMLTNFVQLIGQPSQFITNMTHIVGQIIGNWDLCPQFSRVVSQYMHTIKEGPFKGKEEGILVAQGEDHDADDKPAPSPNVKFQFSFL
ncbi:hypothetical protein M3Y96_00156900 [Aphelenchoides besseyi]|nr:hypothetical protein M3Y96_00156900 [Aphelenchoides besseyi]